MVKPMSESLFFCSLSFKLKINLYEKYVLITFGLFVYSATQPCTQVSAFSEDCAATLNMQEMPKFSPSPSLSSSLSHYLPHLSLTQERSYTYTHAQ